MINILMISVAKMDTGGIESYLMTLFRNISDDIHIDFVVHSTEKGSLEEEIYNKGSKIYKLPRLSKQPIKYGKELYDIIKEGNYDIVHRHATASIMWVDLAIAKWAGCKNRIAHSHNSSWKHKNIHTIFIPLLNHYSTDRFACSKEAGEWMFKNKNFIVMNNGIDVNKFKYDANTRNMVRKSMGLEKKKVILLVARLVPEKNHLWFLNVTKKIQNIDNDFVFLFAGEGILLNDIKNKIEELNIKNTILLGNRNDINQLMCASDGLVLPSLFEGLGIVLIEAQCTGLPCIISNYVPIESNLGLVKQIDLNIEQWSNEIIKLLKKQIDRDKGQELIVNHNYSFLQTSKKIEEYYRKCVQ